MAYDAFISYSHAVDGRLAPALQRGLRRLARPWYRARALAVFRDETDLAVSPHLWASIVRALDESEWFVVLCSPEAAGSDWVAREIDHWLANKDPERILLVLTDGELAWDQKRGAFNPARSTALPPTLLGTLNFEPRHLDLRWARGEEQLDLRHARFRPAVAELAAPIRNMARDELEAEDVRQHRRSVRLARGATSALVLLLIVALTLGGLAWQQRRAAQRQGANAQRERDVARREANLALAGNLASESLSARRDGRNDLALLLAVEAERAQPSVSSQSNLLSALLDQPTLDRQLHGLSHATSGLAFSPDGYLFTASDGKQLRVWDLRSGQPLAHQPNLAGAQFADSGRLWVGMDGPGLVISDVTTGRVLQSLPARNSTWAVSVAAPVVAVQDAGTVQVWDVRSGKRVASIATARPDGKVALSPDGASVAVVSSDTRAWNIATRLPLGPGCPDGAPSNGTVLLGLNVLPDDQTIRVVTKSGQGATSADIARCHVTTGTSEPPKRVAMPSNVHPLYRQDTAASVDAVAPDDQTLATRDPGGTIQVADLSSQSSCSSSCVPLARAPFTERTSNADIVFSPDSRYFAATEDSGDVRIWRAAPLTDVGDGTHDAKATLYQLLHIAMPAQVVSSPGRHVAVTSQGDIIDQRTQQRLGHLADTPTRMSLSADGRLLAASTSNALTVVDLQLHTSHTLRTDSIGCNADVWPAISDRLAMLGCTGPSNAPQTTSSSVLQPIDIASWPWRTGTPIPVRGHYSKFSPDGKTLAVFGDDGSVQFVDIGNTGPHPRPSSPALGVDGVFTPDSSTLVVAQQSGNGLVELVPVNPTSQPTVLSLTGATAVCSGFSDCGHGPAVGVSSDGKLLAAFAPGSVHVWKLTTRQLIGEIPIATFDVDPNGAQLTVTDTSVTVDGFGSRLVVDIDPTSWARAACTIADRNLTRAEWTDYAAGVPYHKTCPTFP